MAGERSTTVRFTDEVYARLEDASRRTGLPINSVVTIACLEWLQSGAGRPAWVSPGPSFRHWRRETSELRPGPLGHAEPPHYPFEMFSASAQRGLEKANSTAQTHGQAHIGTEHLLLGLLEVESGLASKVLLTLGLTADFLVQRYGAPARAEGRRPNLLPSSRLRSVIRHAYDEAFGAGSGYVGTEHLLLGVLAEPESVGARILGEAGVTGVAVRAELDQLKGAEEA